MLRLTGFIAVILAVFASANAQTVEVETAMGAVRGLRINGAEKFLSIPYAEAPVGINRWKAPITKAPWYDTPLDATQDPPGCPQLCELPPHTCPEVLSEDCLFLNVFRPENTQRFDNLPVMVFFHGGNYKQGYSGGLLYDSSKVAEQANVIVVTVNYRLGALGYLGVPEHGIKGNFGLLDQVASLRWVAAQIPFFGGNANRVTIFGQSAGAGSVAALLTCYEAKGYFHGAIMHSNPFSIPFRTVKSMDAIATVFFKNLGCEKNDSACYLGKTADEIITAQDASETDMGSVGESFLSMFLPWTPMVDGNLVPLQPQVAFQNMMYATDIPIMLGFTKDEGDIFILKAFGTEVDSLKYSIMVNLIFGFERGGKVTTKFPGLPAPFDHRELLITEANEYIFHCANRDVANSLAKTRSKSFVYHFNHVMSFSHGSWGPDFPMCYDKVCHAGELPFFFNSAHVLFDYTEEEKQLARSMIRFWGNFAYTGNPNFGPVPEGSNTSVSVTNAVGDLLRPEDVEAFNALNGQTSAPPLWPVYDHAQKHVLQLTVASAGGIVSTPFWHDTQCQFWDNEVKYVF